MNKRTLLIIFAVLICFLPARVIPAGYVARAALGDQQHDGTEKQPDPQADLKNKSYTLSITGNSNITDKDLLKSAAAELRMFEEKGYRKADIDDAAFQMRSTYLQEGYAFAIVDYDYEKTDSQVSVTFRVEEGPRVYVTKINFSGNEHIGSDILQGIFAVKSTSFNRQQKMVFVESDIKDGVNSLRGYYSGEGYRDVQVEKPDFVFSEDRTGVTVSIRIEEGPKYIISEVQFNGDIIAELSPELEKIKKDYLGKTYYLRRKLLLKSSLEEAYDAEGYADAEFVIEVIDLEEPGRIAMRVLISSGGKVRISEVHISGNKSTRASFIRHRLVLKPGDLYTNAKSKESFRRLFDTGLFSKINIELAPPQKDGTRDLEVKVEELPTREVYIEPGWGSYEKLRLMAGVHEKNLFGTGREGRLNGLISTKGESVTVSYTDPWLLQTKITMNAPVFYEHRDEPSYTSEEIGISALFSRNFKKNLLLTAGYEFKVTQLYSLTGDPLLDMENEDYNKGTVGIQAVWDNRDDIFYPAAGLRLSGRFDISLPELGGDLEYCRFTLGARYFFKLPQDVILGLRATTGLIIPLGSQISIPIRERFFNGGDNTVRSYKHHELGPKDLNNEPIGGLGYNVFSVELRKMIYKNFAATLFVDAGNVSPNKSLLEADFVPYNSSSSLLDDTLNDFFSEFKFGIGIGLQYLLPVGPIRFDIAYNPDAVEFWHENSWVYHFSVGMAF